MGEREATAGMELNKRRIKLLGRLKISNFILIFHYYFRLKFAPKFPTYQF